MINISPALAIRQLLKRRFSSIRYLVNIYLKEEDIYCKLQSEIGTFLECFPDFKSLMDLELHSALNE